jgi:hypothetical protein
LVSDFQNPVTLAGFRLGRNFARERLESSSSESGDGGQIPAAVVGFRFFAVGDFFIRAKSRKIFLEKSFFKKIK